MTRDNATSPTPEIAGWLVVVSTPTAIAAAGVVLAAAAVSALIRPANPAL